MIVYNHYYDNSYRNKRKNILLPIGRIRSNCKTPVNFKCYLTTDLVKSNESREFRS